VVLSGWLAQNRLSDNAGCVKYFFPTRLHPLGEERHFALVDGFALCSTNQGSLVISFKSDISIRPMHLFGRMRDHDYYFELLFAEERNAQSITRCSTAHHGDVRAVPRANRIL